jgi:hypothetical protein
MVAGFLLANNQANAQKFKYSVPGLDTLEAFIVGGGSTAVLKKGKAEVIWNNTLSSYWLAFHQSDQNSPILDRFRRSLFQSDLFMYYGFSYNGRWDIGIQAKYVRSRLDNSASSSMFKVFQKESAGEDQSSFYDSDIFFDKSFGGLGHLGLRFRFIPILSTPELVVNGGYAVSTVKDETKQLQLGADRDIADLGFTYFKQMTPNAYYYFSGLVQTFFPSSVRDQYLFNTNASFYLVHRTTNNKFTFYPGLSYNFSFRPSELESNPSLIKVADFLFAFAGLQYSQPSARNCQRLLYGIFTWI